MAAHPSHLRAGPGGRWLMLAAEMAGLVNGGRQPAPDAGPAGRVRPPRIATRLLGPDTGSVRAARDFTVATLGRWGMAERSPDITIVVSELLTNALRHALPASGQTAPRRPVWLGLLQPGPCVLCAVADPSNAAPAPQTPGFVAETGRGLHIIGALSDQWGYTTPSQAGKVVWALFHSPLIPPSPARHPRRPGLDRVQHLAARQDQTSVTGPSPSPGQDHRHRAPALDPHPQITCG